MAKATQQSQVTTLEGQEDGAQPAVAAAVTEAVTLRGTNDDAELSGKKATLTVHSDQGDGGTDAVFVSLNGYAYQIPRDKPYQVPMEVVQVLRDARVTHYRPGPAGAVIEDTRPRYAFSVEAAA